LPGGGDEVTMHSDVWVLSMPLHTFEKQAFSPAVLRPAERQHLGTITRRDPNTNYTKMYIYGGVSQSSYLNGAFARDLLASHAGCRDHQ
jgi:hypothetical protein